MLNTYTVFYINNNMTDVIVYHLKNKNKLVKTESKTVIARGLGVGYLGRSWSKSTNKFQMTEV